MGNLFPLLWRTLAGIATALGFAAVARKYAEPPPRQPEDGRRKMDEAPRHFRLAPMRGTQPAHGAALRPGWSTPKPETIPPPTYWPAVFALGLTFIMWGVISNIFLFCFGFVVTVIGLVYWVLDLRHEYSGRWSISLPSSHRLGDWPHEF